MVGIRPPDGDKVKGWGGDGEENMMMHAFKHLRGEIQHSILARPNEDSQWQKKKLENPVGTLDYLEASKALPRSALEQINKPTTQTTQHLTLTTKHESGRIIERRQPKAKKQSRAQEEKIQIKHEQILYHKIYCYVWRATVFSR